MVTVRDVASLAGVSISTVSRALSAPTVVSAETRRRVIEAADKLGYSPNPAARGLRVGRTQNLGLLVPDLENPFFAAITKAVQSRARANGYAVFIADSDEDPGLERELIASLVKQVDGLILASPRSADQYLLEIAQQVPCVTVNREVDPIDSVTIDNVDGVTQAVSHLRALGHRTIAFASGPARSWSGAERRRGLDAVKTQFDDTTVIPLGHFSPHFSGGYPAADLAVASGATGVIAFNDLMALGIVDRLRQRGVVVPDAMSVVGFDDVSVAALGAPALTTVQAPLAGLGRTSVDLLVAALEVKPDGGSAVNDEPCTHLQLPVEIVVRGSTTVPHMS